MLTHLVPRTAAALVATTGLILGGATAAGAMTHTTATPTVPTKTTKPAMVPIEKNAFMPSALTVTVGQAVTWTNEDDVPHTVTTTSAPVTFDSGTFDKGKSFTYTFTQPGLYKYYCAVHPDMTGSVTVVTKTAPAPAPDPAPAPAPKSEHGMAGMGPGADKPADDPISGAMNPFMAHMQSAHFSRSVGGQIQDLAEFDTWMKVHEALFRMMLDPEVGRSSALGSAPGTSVFMQHMDAAHWSQSPAAQVAAITDDTPTWISSHQAMFQMMLTSLAAGHARH